MYYTTVKMSYKRFIIQRAKLFFFFIISIQFVSCRLQENLSNQSSGVQISYYLYSMKCSWIISVYYYGKSSILTVSIFLLWLSISSYQTHSLKFCPIVKPVLLIFQKSLHVLEHLLKSDIPGVASKMSHQCTNLQEITKTESGNVLSKAKKVSWKIQSLFTFLWTVTSSFQEHVLVVHKL